MPCTEDYDYSHNRASGFATIGNNLCANGKQQTKILNLPINNAYRDFVYLFALNTLSKKLMNVVNEGIDCSTRAIARDK